MCVGREWKCLGFWWRNFSSNIPLASPSQLCARGCVSFYLSHTEMNKDLKCLFIHRERLIKNLLSLYPVLTMMMMMCWVLK